jgi:hypothetical protein
MTATTTSPTLVRIVLTSENMNTAQVEKILDFTVGQEVGSDNHGNRLATFIEGGLNRVWPQLVELDIGAARASATLTLASTGPTVNETCAIAGVTFTAETTGATGNQFNLGVTGGSPDNTKTAANLAAAVNASVNCAGLVTATAALGVVTITCVVPGVVGNFVTLDAGTLLNTTASHSTLQGGTEGDEFTINLK